MTQALMASQHSFGRTGSSRSKEDIGGIRRELLRQRNPLKAFRVFAANGLPVMSNYRSALIVQCESIHTAMLKHPRVLLSRASSVKNVLHSGNLKHGVLACRGKLSVQREQHAPTQAGS